MTDCKVLFLEKVELQERFMIGERMEALLNRSKKTIEIYIDKGEKQLKMLIEKKSVRGRTLKFDFQNRSIWISFREMFVYEKMKMENSFEWILKGKFTNKFIRLFPKEYNNSTETDI